MLEPETLSNGGPKEEEHLNELGPIAKWRPDRQGIRDLLKQK